MSRILQKGYIYKVSTIDGKKVYIGSSGIPPHLRFSCHIYSAKTGKMPGLSEIFAEGWPLIDILEEHTGITKAELRVREQYFIEQFRGVVLNKNNAVFDRDAFMAKQRAEVECPSCGKFVQYMYLRRHMKQDKCINHDFNAVLKEFGRLPCQFYRQKRAKPANPAPEAANPLPNNDVNNANN